MGTGFFSSIEKGKRQYLERTDEKKEKDKVYKKEYFRREEIKKRRRINQQELRDLSKEIGNCTHCYNPNPNLKYSYCPKCRKKQRDRARIKYNQNKSK